MALGRDDRVVQDALGRNLPGAQVFWCSQPATVPTTAPPSPLMTIYTDLTGATPLAQPVISDGFGHAIAYLPTGVLFTLVIYHPLFGVNPVIWKDQILGGSGGAAYTPFSGIPSGSINGSNKVFTLLNGAVPLTSMPVQNVAWLNFPLIQGLGYTLALVGSQVQITYAQAPQPASGSTPADSLYAEGWY